MSLATQPTRINIRGNPVLGWANGPFRERTDTRKENDLDYKIQSGKQLPQGVVV